MVNVSPMGDAFHDWLEECPVQWFRDKSDHNSATYTFIEDPDQEDVI